MHGYQRSTRAALIVGAMVVVGCGGDEGTTPGPMTMTAGTAAVPPVGTAGTLGTAGMGLAGRAGVAGTGVAGTGTVGRGTAGTGAAGTAPATAGGGAAGTGAAGTMAAATAGMSAGTAGTGAAGTGAAGMMAAAGTGASGTGSTSNGSCCADCICRGEVPAMLPGDNKGPFRTSTMRASTGTLHFPMDAEPPFAGIAICPGFTNTGPEMRPWGEFYASWGIVTMVTNTSGADQPATRGRKLLAAVAEMKEMNSGSGPISGKMSGRYGTSGYSMGGGGTTIASGDDSTLKSSVGLAAWGGSGSGVTVPTLLLCGSSDSVAPCSMSSSVYRGIGGSTPKMLVTISGATHFAWFGPEAGRGQSGGTALAFQKVYLEGDERWKPLLAGAMSTQSANIK